MSTQNQDGIQRMVDIEQKISQGKGTGYIHWAKKFNLQQMSQTMVYLEKYGFHSPEDVDNALQEAIRSQNHISHQIRELEQRISDNKELLRQIAVYRKTKPVYDGLKKFKKAKQRAKYEEENRTDFALFSASGKYFKEKGITKLPATPKVREENEKLISQKTSLYTDLREQESKTAELRRIKSNLHSMLQEKPKTRKREETLE